MLENGSSELRDKKPSYIEAKPVIKGEDFNEIFSSLTLSSSP
jgi:hypothetical protein